MDIKITVISLCFIVGITSLFSTCKKSECISFGYTFKENWRILPEKDSINVGDTLSFFSEFSNRPLDHNTNKNVDFSGNAVINTTLGIYVLKAGATNLGSAVDSFQYIIQTGRVETNSSTAPDHIKQIYYAEMGEKYILDFKIVAKKKGIYALGFSNGLAKRKASSSCEDNAGVAFSNANTNNHIYYLEEFYGTTNLPVGEREHGYCFKVK